MYVDTIGKSEILFEKDGDGATSVSGSDSILSDMMPDIAMATASINQMSLHDLHLAQQPQPPDLELDLGDGNNHSGNGTLYI